MEVVMKKTILCILIVALTAVSCHKPEYVKPTADRQGLTSLTAIFTFGPYVDQELAKLVIDDDSQSRFVIPVPYYFPASSENQTLAYMVNVRVIAELQPNFKIEPPLTLLDLTEENKFTYTDPFGKSREIIITGERVKSSECDVLSFTLGNPTVAGVVDKANRTIILPTRDDVSHATATVAVSAHASVFPDLSKPRDYTNGLEFTVTADDGTEAVYKVMTGDPEKLDQGINPESLEHLFHFDPVTRMGQPDYTTWAAISLAAIEGKFIVCLGDGSVPKVFDGLTGDKIGEMNIGSAVAGAITNDEMEHMLITNVAKGGDEREAVQLYKTSSVNAAPELLYMFENPIDVPIGHRIKVMGDIEKDAVITFTAEGVEGVTTTAKAVYLTVKNGAVVSTDVVDFAAVTGGWGAAPVNIATIVPASLTPKQDGWFYDYYEGNADADGNYLLHYCTAAGVDNIVARIGNWANNPNCLDSKQFNNCRYMALFVVSHFPQWGIAPQLHLFNITDPTSAAIEASKPELQWYQQGAAGYASGDVVIAPSADGYKMYVYYYDHNAQAVGAYVVDCIKR